MTPEQPAHTSTKCHPCRAKGLKRIEFYVTPDRKDRIIQYCQQRGFTAAGLMDSLLRKEHL
ncbi:RepB family protein [Spirosoma areae]